MTLNTQVLADRLGHAEQTRTPIAQLTDEFPELDLVTAYSVQDVLRARAGALGGWKLGVTSRAKQKQVGVDSPIFGFLPASGALDLGEPLDVSTLIHPRCEPEIVFVIGRDLAGPRVTAAHVLQATAALAVGIEVLDSRFVDFRFTMPDVVADNTSASRYVVGNPIPLQQVPHPQLLGVVLAKNGEVVDTAAGAASMGNPAAAVAWMVRAMSERGLMLRPGDIVLSGGLTAAVPVGAGDTVSATIDRLGAVEIACR